jgi:2-iminobutanoate/2-iminopropanoate deaminase
MLFLSGLASIDEAGKLVGADDIVEQTRKTLSNMRLVLHSVGADFCDLLKVVVYVTDVKDMAKINTVRKEMFGQYRPASTLVEVSRLALPDMKIEIEAVAGIPSTASGGNR